VMASGEDAEAGAAACQPFEAQPAKRSHDAQRNGSGVFISNLFHPATAFCPDFPRHV